MGKREMHTDMALAWKVEGKSRFERRRHRWKNNVNTDLKDRIGMCEMD
jgi:hypothetical protein